MKLALLSNFQLLGAAEVERYNRLSHELEQRDTQLLLLTTNVVDGLELKYLQIPYALREFRHLGVPPVAVPNENQLVAIEEHWIRDFSLQEAREGARACRSFYQSLLTHLQPDFVGAWNTLFPQSRILQMLCEELSIPAFTFERGFLPGTLMLDRLRNNVDSELNNSFSSASLFRRYPKNADLIKIYRKFYDEQRPSKYLPGEKNDRQQQDRLLATVDKPLVLALSQSHGAGIYPRSHPSARRNFAHFATLTHALRELMLVCPDHQVAFRDHPLNNWENAPTELPEGVIRLDHGPFGDLLPHADVVVSFGSTTAIYEVLLQDKPLIVVGDSAIGRFDPYVRCSDGDLRTALASALDEQQQAHHRERAASALSFLLEHFLIADDPAVSLPHRLSDLAEFIAGYDLHCASSLEARFSALSQWISAN